MRERILALAHFLDPVDPAVLAKLSDKMWGMGDREARAIITKEIRDGVMDILPYSGRVFFIANNPPEEDPIIKKFLDEENFERLIEIIDEHDKSGSSL